MPLKNIIGKLLLFFLLLLIPYSLFAAQEGSQLTHEMVQLIFQVSIIILAARIGGDLFEKLHLPGVLGEIIAGMLIGPFLLGQIPLPGFEHGVFPLNGDFPVSNELYGITTIASIILLFLVGLETDIETFLTFSFAGSWIGIGGVLVSFLIGNAVTVFCSKLLMGIPLNFSDPVPLFMGIVSTATSVGISARILSEKKKMDSPEGVTILSGAVIDDVLGIILLAVILGVIKSGHVVWSKIGLISLKALTIWLGFTFLGLYFSPYISRFLKRFKDNKQIAIISLSLALFLSGIFEKSGLAMIIGAYIMGLSLSKTDLSFVIQENLSSLYNFFVPIFFCVMGMLVNFRELASPKIFLFGIVFVIFSILGKILGCGFPALFLNFNMRGALRIGVGMVPRGEVGMIIAGIGLSAGILQHEYFGIVIMMTFVTTLLTPPFLSYLLESDKPVLKKAKQPKIELEEVVYVMPNEDTADFILNKLLLFFEAEGFYIHSLNIEKTLFQLRKDQTFIAMRYVSPKLTFDCQSKDVALIHTIFFEVIAELEHMMRNIQALSYKDKIGKKIFTQKNGQTTKIQKIHFPGQFSPNAISSELQGNTKTEIISELIGLLVSSNQIQPSVVETAYQDVLEREKSMSTGMQDGIALPHARTSAVSQLVCAIGIKKAGIDFDSLDKKPSKIFILTLSPKETSEPQLQFMAGISKILQIKEIRGKIISSKTNQELFDFLHTFFD